MKTILGLLLGMTIIFSSCVEKKHPFHFYVVTDVHMTKQRPDYTSLCFKEDILPDIKNDTAGLGKFIVVTGDMDPFFRTRESVEDVMGKDFRFYPVLGNHDVGMTNNRYELYPDANWGNTFDIVKYNKNNLKNIAEWGPEYHTPALDSLVYVDSLGHKHISTYDSLDVIGSKYTTYSFDEGNSHFVILDIYSGLEYFSERHCGRIFKELYNWLDKDLSATDKENIFVFAHQPVWETVGEDTMSLINNAYKDFCIRNAKTMGADSTAWFEEHYNSKVKSRQEFWNLLKKHNVVAYFCGHIHHYSATKHDGVWEINMETGAWNIEGRTRYAKIFVDDKNVELQVMGYRNDPKGFKLIETVRLK